MQRSNKAISIFLSALLVFLMMVPLTAQAEETVQKKLFHLVGEFNVPDGQNAADFANALEVTAKSGDQIFTAKFATKGDGQYTVDAPVAGRYFFDLRPKGETSPEGTTYTKDTIYVAVDVEGVDTSWTITGVSGKFQGKADVTTSETGTSFVVGDTTLYVVPFAGEQGVSMTEPAVNVPATGVKLDQSSVKVALGTTATLVATVEPDNTTNKNVTWESKDTTIATVDKGVITPVKVGKTTVTVTTEDGKFTASAEVEVTEAGKAEISKLKATPTSVNLKPGKTRQLKVFGITKDGKQKDLTKASTGTTYESSDSTLVTVSADGLVKVESGKKGKSKDKDKDKDKDKGKKSEVTITIKNGGKTTTVRVKIT
ncbi:Ig-like domain-containing protein [Brevibacillus sp. SYSU BS000544]|uniref:Ig-like domain-containing protein n=1 Tax=Brevibacillus sp. SYSU BS000544 TaxID=3416443 RepID=UPI003CE4DB2E